MMYLAQSWKCLRIQTAVTGAALICLSVFMHWRQLLSACLSVKTNLLKLNAAQICLLLCCVQTVRQIVQRSCARRLNVVFILCSCYTCRCVSACISTCVFNSARIMMPLKVILLNTLSNLGIIFLLGFLLWHRKWILLKCTLVAVELFPCCTAFLKNNNSANTCVCVCVLVFLGIVKAQRFKQHISMGNSGVVKFEHDVHNFRSCSEWRIHAFTHTRWNINVRTARTGLAKLMLCLTPYFWILDENQNHFPFFFFWRFKSLPL